MLKLNVEYVDGTRSEHLCTVVCITCGVRFILALSSLSSQSLLVRTHGATATGADQDRLSQVKTVVETSGRDADL